MAEDDFLMGDDLFGSDFEDLISKDDLITTEGLNYFWVLTTNPVRESVREV